jgi:hypothetical protein
MGRRRLMTILAGIVAAVGLQIGPAAALDLGLVEVDVSDGVKVEAELTDSLDVEAEVSSEPKVEVGDTELDGSEVTERVEKTVEEVADGSGRTSPDPSPSEEPSEADGGTAGGSSSGSSAETGSEPADEDRQVTAAGRSGSFLSPEREAQIEAFRAMRDANSPYAGATFDGRVVPGVQLAPRMAPTDDDRFTSPDVAPGIEVAAPSVVGDGSRQAQLASTPFGGTLPEVPVALQLLAGTLVAGTALAWHLARQELGAVELPGRSSR